MLATPIFYGTTNKTLIKVLKESPPCVLNMGFFEKMRFKLQVVFYDDVEVLRVFIQYNSLL